MSHIVQCIFSHESVGKCTCGGETVYVVASAHTHYRMTQSDGDHVRRDTRLSPLFQLLLLFAGKVWDKAKSIVPSALREILHEGMEKRLI